MNHIPVLLSEVESIFGSPEKPITLVDATLGLGGHAEMMLAHAPQGSLFIGIDRDSDNLTSAEKRLGHSGDGVEKFFCHDSFVHIDDILTRVHATEVDFALYDLGVSSAHYDDGDRGFSIRSDAPLDMRFDRTGGKTARDLIMNMSEYELRDIMVRYADEKKAFFIARAIVESRKQQDIKTTFDLIEIIHSSSYDPNSVKRVFQALRIAVNDEFGHIETSLEKMIDRLSIGGILAVITFHSIEDRLVKSIFSRYLTPQIDEVTGQETVPPRIQKYTKKPIEPTPLEIEMNPRSRSAKLRVVTRIH